MAEAEMKVPNPEGRLCVRPAEAKAKAGASPEGQAGADEDPREPPIEEDRKDLPEAGPTTPGNMEVLDPEDHLWVSSEKAIPRVSPERQAGAEEDPRKPPIEEDREVLPEAGPTGPGAPLPAHVREGARGAGGGGRGDARPPACPPLLPPGSAQKGKRAPPACEEESKFASVPKKPLHWAEKEEERKPGGEDSPSPSFPGKERRSQLQEAPALRRNEAKPGPAVSVLNSPENSGEQESGSEDDSNEGKVSSEAHCISLCSKFENVSKFEVRAAGEFLKVMAGPANVFVHVLQENKHLMQENKHLMQENKQLQASHEAEVARLKAEIQQLKQDLQEARSKPTWSQRFAQSLFKTNFHIQVLVMGRTESCENQFLKKVSDVLSNQGIDLKQHKYQESSGHFLLVFCPVSSRVGTDMYNALEGLKGDPKAVLVMLHHKPMQSTCFVDTKLQAEHPAVVHTVHARYTIQEGFYTCPMNEEAVAIVAEVLEDRFKRGKVDPATTGALSKSLNT